VDAWRRGACLAGASAGAMAFGDRTWTPGGPVDGLRLLPGTAVIPHFDPARGEGWRRAVDPDGVLTWIGLPERTLALGGPGGSWTVVGAEAATWIRPGTPPSAG
jgi:cyanophycinase-like exopeptidase